jgi:hypothetical protein
VDRARVGQASRGTEAPALGVGPREDNARPEPGVFYSMRSPWERLAAAMASHKVLTGIGAFILLSIIVYAVDPHAANSTKNAAPSPTATTTQPAAATPRASSESAATTTARGPEFPPKTLASFRAFAATGDAKQVHQIGRREAGLPSCPDTNVYVTVSRAISGRALEADLSAFVVQKGLLGNRCQAFVFAFHSHRDYRAHLNDGYTVGRVAITTNSGSGPPDNLELDIGNVSQVMGVKGQFNFNF